MKITVSTKLPNFHFIVRELLMGVAVGNMIEPFVNKEFHMHFELRGIEVLYGWLTQLHGPSVVKQCLSTLRHRKKFMHWIGLY